jgi:hypothetical protein
MAILGIISNKIYSQADNPAAHKSDSSDVNFGIGAGISLSGFTAGISSTYHVSDGWGVSISYKMNSIQTKNLPEDFNSTTFVLIPPHDNINVLSLNLCKKITVSHNKLTFSVEGGLAYILYKVTNFRINPDYYTSELTADFKFENKYLKSKTYYNSVGLSLRVGAHYYLIENVGIETALYANINKFKPIIGLEFYVPFRLPDGK